MSRAEISGRLRRLRTDVSRRSARVERAVSGDALLGDLESTVRRGSEKGRQRAAARLRAALPDVFGWVPVERGVLGAFLDAQRDPVIVTPTDPGQTQSCVIVAYALLGTERLVSALGLWTLEVPDHAIRRALARDPAGCALAKIRDAHGALTRAGVAGAPRIGTEFLIPTSGPGVFVAEWILGRCKRAGEEMVYARARTWLHDDQLAERQTQPVLRSAAPGEETLLGAGLLAPVALRVARASSYSLGIAMMEK